MCIVTKATPIQFINSKCHIKKRKSHKTALSRYYACLSRDLLLMPLEADTQTHTQAHTHTPTFANETISKTRSVQACGLHMPGLIKIKGVHVIVLAKTC